MSPDAQKKRERKLAAFDAIVSAYEGPLLRYATRLVWHHDAAQNVVQDAFVRLFQKWDGPWEPCPKLSAWLYRVTHNCAVDYLRREQRLEWFRLKHAEDWHKSHINCASRSGDISDEAARAAEALRKLSLREQQLVILKVYEGRSYEEISQITGLSAGNVGFILHHAMKKLGEIMKKGST